MQNMKSGAEIRPKYRNSTDAFGINTPIWSITIEKNAINFKLYVLKRIF